MKLFYFSIGHVEEGVKKKLTDKAEAFRKTGIDVTICWVASNVTMEDDKLGAFIPIDQSLARWVGRLFFFWRFSQPFTSATGTMPRK